MGTGGALSVLLITIESKDPRIEGPANQPARLLQGEGENCLAKDGKMRWVAESRAEGPHLTLAPLLRPLYPERRGRFRRLLVIGAGPV